MKKANTNDNSKVSAYSARTDAMAPPHQRKWEWRAPARAMRFRRVSIGREDLDDSTVLYESSVYDIRPAMQAPDAFRGAAVVILQGADAADPRESIRAAAYWKRGAAGHHENLE